MMWLSLADKSGGIVDFCGNTSSNRAGAWSHHAFVQLFPITQQSHAFFKPPYTSPIAASGATNIKNVKRFVRQWTVSHFVPAIHGHLPQATARHGLSHQQPSASCGQTEVYTALERGSWKLNK